MTCKYYTCEICGNVLKVVDDSGVTPTCCGQEMTKSEKDEK